MARMKTFFIYFLLIVLFFIFSQIMIYIAINTTFQYKNIEIKTNIPMEVEVQATSINGYAKGKVINNEENEILNKYIKVECYSKHDTLMGTKYIKIDKIGAKEEKERLGEVGINCSLFLHNAYCIVYYFAPLA